MPAKSRGTIRAGKANLIFRLVFGLVFIGLGINQYSRGGPFVQTAYFSFIIGALFVGFGIYGLIFVKAVSSRLEMETPTPTERLNELTKLKTSGAISEAEFQAKRQEILKEL